MRYEKDFLGEEALPEDFPYGIHTFRAMENFSFSRDRIREDLFLALVQVKKAAAAANMKAGLLEESIAGKIIDACDEIVENIAAYVPDLHPFQGGAGTSTNMAANELIANIALKRMGKPFGAYEIISPLDHVNLSQSTNDTYPTAVRIAIIRGLRKLHDSVESLLDVLLVKEKEFAHILKIGRTELQDAMPISLGQSFSAWAEAVGRFRWRLDKAVDWIRDVNISGTAIGTSINADRTYSRYVIEALREIVREPVSLARNLIDGTQNIDQIVEVSGLIRTGAVSIKKMSLDIRLLSSGPKCGLGELRLPQMQAGSSMMPGKVNPVMFEAAEQVCLSIMGGDAVIAAAAAESNFELPQFLPLISHVILTNNEMFTCLLNHLSNHIKKIKPNIRKLEENVYSSTAAATLLTPTLGYETVAELVKEAERDNRDIIGLIREKNLIDPRILEKLVSPQVMASPGLPLLEHE
jgi:aspartate ammonia-lyase